MLLEPTSNSRQFSLLAPKYREASKICCGFPNQNKLLEALEHLGPEERPYALVYLDGHIECANSDIQKRREIQGQYYQLKKHLGFDYPKQPILLEAAAKLINESYQIKLFFDCNQSLKYPRLERYVISKHQNRSSSYISMYYEPFNDYLHIYPDELKSLIDACNF